MGVQPNDESKHDEMLSILETLQEFAPRYEPELVNPHGSEESDAVEDQDAGVELINEDDESGQEGEYRSACNYMQRLQGVLLGGDQLSCSLARHVIADRINSMNDVQGLKGLIPVVEDWHSKLCLLTVSPYIKVMWQVFMLFL